MAAIRNLHHEAPHYRDFVFLWILPSTLWLAEVFDHKSRTKNLRFAVEGDTNNCRGEAKSANILS